MSCDNLKSHFRYHNVKQWLLDGARREDALTIKAAVHRCSTERIIEALVRVLSEHGDD